jgi:hypothetical protein
MNLKQLSSKFNKTPEQIVEASKELFNEVPSSFNDEQINKLANHFSNNQPKQLAATPKKPEASENKGTLANGNANGSSKIQQNIENLVVNQQEVQDKLDHKLVESAQLKGIYKARAAKQVEFDAFIMASINEDIDFYNKIVNGSLASAIKHGSMANNASGINNFQMAEIIDTQAVLMEAHKKNAALPPSPEELMKLLPPSDAEMRRLLDEM